MKVLVGMSGGVDSSLAAALLVEQGHQVVGAYMKNWTLDVPGMTCPWAEDLAYAKRTAVKLGIDLRVYDFQEAYKRDVVDYLVREYEAGRTPNPDIMCNQDVKFGLFLETARAEGFDCIATGHYARKAEPPQLLRAVDEHKDQTYFLYRMGADALKHTLFPLGTYTKDEVRTLAAARKLPAANKPDSQGICFIGEAPIQDFLRLYVQPKPGKIIDADTGTLIGAHDGALFFTLGQRKGLGVGGGAPYYVVGKNMDTNEVYVSHNAQSAALQTSEILLEDCSWLAGETPGDGRYLVRTRHTGALVEAHCSFNSVPAQHALDGGAADATTAKSTAAIAPPTSPTAANASPTAAPTPPTAHLQFSKPQERVAPGQSVVLYAGEICLGGGIVAC